MDNLRFSNKYPKFYYFDILSDKTPSQCEKLQISVDESDSRKFYSIDRECVALDTKVQVYGYPFKIPQGEGVLSIAAERIMVSNTPSVQT